MLELFFLIDMNMNMNIKANYISELCSEAGVEYEETFLF